MLRAYRVDHRPLRTLMIAEPRAVSQDSGNEPTREPTTPAMIVVVSTICTVVAAYALSYALGCEVQSPSQCEVQHIPHPIRDKGIPTDTSTSWNATLSTQHLER